MSFSRNINFFLHNTTCLEHNVISLDQYNQLMSNMLNERCALAKLRAELEGKERRMCRQCRRFEHLTQKYRNGKKQKKKTVVGNRFEVLKNRVM